MKKAFTVFIISILLLGLIAPLSINLVAADVSYVYIRANGSIDPSYAPIYTTDCVNYVLTGNMIGQLVIQKNNVVLDGAGHFIRTENSFAGVTLFNVTGVTVRNVIVKESFLGVFIDSSSFCQVSNCTILGLYYGIVIGSEEGYARNNTISGNNITSSYFVGMYMFRAANNTITNNSIVCEEGLYLDYSSNNTIYRNNFVNRYTQVYQYYNDANYWDYNGQGNYWVDYLSQNPNATQIGNTGIWNIPYTIDGGISNGNSADRYPLVNPIGFFVLNITSFGAGNTNPDEGLYIKNIGSQVQVTASPEPGKAFKHWLFDGQIVTTNPITVTMNKSHTLQAVFEPRTWQLLILPSVNGAVYGENGNRIDGTMISLTEGVPYNITAVPNAGYVFDWWDSYEYWYGEDNPLTITAYGDDIIDAIFTPACQLIVKSAEHGTIKSGNRIIEGTTVDVAQDSFYNLIAIPDSGYMFSYWLLDGQEQGIYNYYGEETAESSNVYVLMDGNHTVQAFFTLAPVYISAPSTADWPMLMHDTSHTGHIDSIVPTTNSTLWIYQTEEYTHSSPVVANGLVYVGSADDKVYALNATNGQLKWSYVTDGNINGAPAVANGVVFVGSYDGYLYALNATNGQLLWKYKTPYGIASSPAVASGVVYVSARESGVYALNATNGQLLWKSPIESSSRVSPAVAYGKVYVTSYYGIYALNAANGQTVWYYEPDSEWFYCSVTVSDGIVYVGSDYGYIYALNATTTNANGQLLWRYEIDDWIYSTLAIADGVAYFGTESGYVYALDLTTTNAQDRIIWCYETDSWWIESSAAVSGGIVYIGSDEGTLYALNATTTNPQGELIWRYETRECICSSPSVANGIVYASSDSGMIYAFASASNVTFNASGLATGTSWSVTFNGITRTSTSSSITFANVLNGNYQYSTTLPAGYSAVSALSGTVTVANSDTTKTVTYAQLQKLLFSMPNLPSGAQWSVTVNGVTQTSTTPSIIFELPSGTYNYAITLPAGRTTIIPLTGTAIIVVSQIILIPI